MFINRELAILKALFNRALEWRLYEGQNPVCSVKFLKEPRRKIRFLEYEEEARLVAAASEPVKSLIILGVNTGLRIGAEALTLRWEHVDLRRGTLTVDAAYAKSGQMRQVPLNSTAKALLQALREHQRGEWVFCRQDGTPFKSVRHGFLRACRRAGIQGVSLHTLRHTFCSRLVQAGVDLPTIQKYGGWKSLDLVERYAHLSDSHKTEAIERISSQNFPTCFTTPLKRQEGTKLISA